MKILFGTGGTAGHVNPALAIADFLVKEKNAEILLIGGTHGIEKKLFSEIKFNVKFIDIKGLDRKHIFKNFSVLSKFFNSIKECKKIIKEFRPDITIGTGGYVSCPVVYASHSCGVPTLIHESNSVPGLTTKLLSKISDRVCVGFPETSKFLSGKNIIVTGNPIRSELFNLTTLEARERLGIKKDEIFILAFGGSLGSSKINNALIDFIIYTYGKFKYKIMISTGKNNKIEPLKSKLKFNGIDIDLSLDIRLAEYINEMEIAMNAADLVICRSGALTVSELIALKKPAILIPSPNVTNDHQFDNARILESRGSGVIIRDFELTGNKLEIVIQSMLKNNKLAEMRNSFDDSLFKNALFEISKLIEELTSKND